MQPSRQEVLPLRKLFSFMVTTLDGFHVGTDGEFDWPNVDGEFHDFSTRS